MEDLSALRCAAVVFFSAFLLTGCGCDEGNGPARIKINNVTSAEGDAGMTEFVFTVTLTSDPGADVTVDYATSDGTATTADNDYVSTSGTITFTTGSGMMFVGGNAQVRTVTVTVYGDTAIEPDETFNVDLFNATNATIADSRGVGTIRNDESEITIGDATGLEGDTGTTDFIFPVSLTADPGVDVTVEYATGDCTAKVADNDYIPISGRITFGTGGPLTQQVAVQITGDTNVEPDEKFNVYLSNPSNATIPDSLGTGTIWNDDVATISLNDMTVTEGDRGTVDAVFTVALAADPGVDVTVDYMTSDGTATAGTDYTAASGTLTFVTGGPLTQTVTISVSGDTDMEPDETFHVELSNPSNATISDNLGIGTIQNDDVLRVDPTGNGTDGLTWATAFRTVQTGVDAAFTAGGGEVWVAAATYTNGGGTGPVVTMAADVHIYGGFEGYAGGSGVQEATLSERDWSTNVTTLDGEDNAYHVAIGMDSATLDGFTVTRGNANGASWPGRCGGGMYNYESSPTVTNCIFSDNSADGDGGGMCNYLDCSPTVTYCTFSGNTAEDEGGGMYNCSSSPAVTNCTFSGNSGDEGGGMYNRSNSSPTVRDCIFSGNSAARYGGGMDNSSSSPMVMNCTFSGNSATWCGGGMDNADNSSTTVTNCTFSANSADYEGGGMFNNWYCSPTVTNCTFSGNIADYGGGMHNYSSSPTVTNCIMWGDTAVVSGPEIANDGTSSVTAAYSDIAGCGGSGAGWDATIGTDGGGNIDSNPLFVDADGADNVYGTADDDLHLTAGSPCIDSADGAAAAATDIEGNPRYDDPGSPNTGVGPPWADMGAYERQ